MFNSSKAYGASFDSGEWQPYGMSDAVDSDTGFNSFVNDPLKAQEEEMRFAGNALGTYAQTQQAKLDMETQLKIADMYKDANKPKDGGGFGVGDALGIATKVAPLALGLFCDMRLKKDVTPLRSTGEVHDKLAAMALSVHHLRDVCS